MKPSLCTGGNFADPEQQLGHVKWTQTPRHRTLWALSPIIKASAESSERIVAPTLHNFSAKTGVLILQPSILPNAP